MSLSDDIKKLRDQAVGRSVSCNVNPLMLTRVLDALDKRTNIADEALLWCEEMLVARDEMNAKVHCAPLRLSPITERVKQAREALTD